MAKLKKKHEQEEPIPMAPMIDMVFLLLVFFMVVSTVAKSAKSKEVDLAESATAKKAEDESDRGIITIDADGVYYIGETPMSLEEMQAAIKKQMQINPKTKLQVRADMATEWQPIKKAMKACASVGAFDIIYSTHQKQ